MFIRKHIILSVLLIILIIFSFLGRYNKSVHGFLKEHRAKYGIIDTLYILIFFSVSQNILELYFVWWLAGIISLLITGLMQNFIYKEKSKKY